LIFENPLQISSKSLPDKLNVTFLNHDYFRLLKRPFISVELNSSIYKAIPKQMPKEGISASMGSITEGIAIASNAMIYA
jgi:hypothetical protein